ncbi:MAG: hypothetical protein EOO75_16460 [Myxococcales bacterium]|nr:MAG: hypothetical protein EOO75_16460 [Myxococcales bacterium]
MGSFSGLGELAVWVPGGEVTPTELPAHWLARMFTLREAETRPGLVGTHSVRGSKGGTSVIRVMPLVPAGWTPDAPVPAWALCPDRVPCQAVVSRPGFATRPASFPGGSASLAVAKAVKEHHLRVVPDAPVLEVGATARDVLRARGFIPLAMTLVFGVPWLVAVVVAWIRQRLRTSGDGG